MFCNVPLNKVRRVYCLVITYADIVHLRRNYNSDELLGDDNGAVAEAPMMGKDIFEYDKNSNGAKDYEALVKEIIERE